MTTEDGKTGIFLIHFPIQSYRETLSHKHMCYTMQYTTTALQKYYICHAVFVQNVSEKCWFNWTCGNHTTLNFEEWRKTMHSSSHLGSTTRVLSLVISGVAVCAFSIMDSIILLFTDLMMVSYNLTRNCSASACMSAQKQRRTARCQNNFPSFS